MDGNRLSVSGGLAYAAQRDEHASPLSYAGVGPLIDLAFTHRAGAALLGIDLSFASSRSTSSITQGPLPYERQRDAALRVTYYRRVYGGDSHRSTWLVGAASGAEFYASDHHFDDPDQRVGSYGIALLSLAPAVRWEIRLGRGVLATHLDVPVVALAWRPYAEFQRVRDVRRRVVTLDALHAAHAAVEYVHPLSSHVDAALTYRVVALEVQETQPYARMSQTLLARLSVRLGGAHR